MAKEIERKWLVNESILLSTTFYDYFIQQGYIMLEEHKQLRIRLLDNGKAVLGLKYTENAVRDEYEYDIPYNDGLELYNKCEFTVEKKRFVLIEDNGLKYEIDVYPNGLRVVEVEFKSLEEANTFVELDWFDEEITTNREYSNITLAKQNLKFNEEK